MRRFVAMAGKKPRSSQKESFHQPHGKMSPDGTQPLLGYGYDAANRSLRAGASTLLPNLSALEEDFFDLVESGNVTAVDDFLQNNRNFNINCQNYCGYSPLVTATQSEHADMVDYLLQYTTVQLSDALLHAVRQGHIAITQLLLNKKRKFSHHLLEDANNFGPTSDSPDFTPDMTPLIMAAHTNNYDIIRLLIEQGHVISKPHPPGCFCSEQCTDRRFGESLSESVSRYNTYRAVTSPAYICQTADDPILDAFHLSVELKGCANVERELKTEYNNLSEAVAQFAVGLLAQCRSTEEVELILHHKGGATVSHKLRRFARVALALECEQKGFIAHPNCQQVLRSAWLEGWHDWKSLNIFTKLARLLPRMLFLPFMALLYWVVPRGCTLVEGWKAPLNKFFSFGASYGVFLVLMLLQIALDNDNLHRGPPQTGLEAVIAVYVTGMLWKNLKVLWGHGLKQYLKNYWNTYDLVMTLTFFGTFICWLLSVIDTTLNGGADIPRYKWNQFDPVLIGESLYAWAIILAFGKLMYFFQIGHELGSLQVSMSWMMKDIFKFLVVFFVVMLSFSVGMHMLYHHYKGWTGLYQGNAATQEPAFSTYKESVRTLYWAIYGYSPPAYADIVTSEYYDNRDNGTVHVQNHHMFTEVMGQTIFALYYIAGIIVMINMLIAMMSNSFSDVHSNADAEWKFARTKVWMSFFEEGNTLPPPFNLVPSPKSLWNILSWCGRKITMNPRARCSTGKCCYFEEDDNYTKEDNSYEVLMAMLVQRYLTRKGRREMLLQRAAMGTASATSVRGNTVYDLQETCFPAASITSLASSRMPPPSHMSSDHM